MDQSLVSVIIPCYNGEQYINRAISSVFSEDYHSVELIVVDDGSTDSSKEIILPWVDKFKSKSWVLKYIYQENGGLGSAINTGLKHVTGVFLSLLDADDEYLPGSISERVAFLQNHPEINVVRSNGWIIKGETRRLFVTVEKEKQCTDIFVPLLRGETNNWAGSYMVRTVQLFAFYPEREIYTSRYGQNLQLLMPLVYQQPCGFIDKPLMLYIQRENSLSQTADTTIAKKQSLENAAGYRDIREYMLRLIIHDAHLLDYYMQQIDEAYWRGILRTASIYRDKTLLKRSYKELQIAGSPSLNDKITFYRMVFPPVALLMRIGRKLVRMLGKEYDNR